MLLLRLILISPFTVPPAPSDIDISDVHLYSTVTANAILPTSVTEDHMPEHFELFISPEPLAKPKTSIVPSVFEFSLETEVQYSITISSVNCAGRSRSISKSIRICKIDTIRVL